MKIERMKTTISAADYRRLITVTFPAHQVPKVFSVPKIVLEQALAHSCARELPLLAAGLDEKENQAE